MKRDYKRGELILFSKGIYDSYDILGTYKVKKNFNLPKLVEEFNNMKLPKNGTLLETFLSWLELKGLVVWAESTEVKLDQLISDL